MDSYLLHDANAGNNFKMMIMMQKEGMKGYSFVLDAAVGFPAGAGDGGSCLVAPYPRRGWRNPAPA